VGSLLEGIDTAPAKGKDAGASRADDTKKVKLIVAAVCLVVGVGLIAWNMGLFGRPSESSPAPTAGGSAAPDPSQIVQPAATAPKGAPVLGGQTPVRP